MKYDLEIEIEPRQPVTTLSLKLDEKTVRDFKYVSKCTGVSMTHVITKMLKEFVSEYNSRGTAKQTRMF